MYKLTPTEAWYRRMSELEEGCDISAGAVTCCPACGGRDIEVVDHFNAFNNSWREVDRCNACDTMGNFDPDGKYVVTGKQAVMKINGVPVGYATNVEYSFNPPAIHVEPYSFKETHSYPGDGTIVIDRVVKVPQSIEFINVTIEIPHKKELSNFWKKYED